jgi:hypothetical protein
MEVNGNELSLSSRPSGRFGGGLNRFRGRRPSGPIRSGTQKRRGVPDNRRIANVVRSVVGNKMELKYFLFSYANNVSWSGVVMSVSDVTQGDSDTTRDGDRLLPKDLSLRGTWVISDTTNVCRVILFRWLPSSTPAVSDIVTSNYVGTTAAAFSPLTHDTRQQYKILADQICILDVSHTVRLLNWNLKLPPQPIQYVAGTTTGSNKLYILVITDSGAASHPGANFALKLTYTDA